MGRGSSGRVPSTFFMRRLLFRDTTVFFLAAVLFGAVASTMTPTLSLDSRFYLRLSDAILAGHAGDAFGTSEQASWTVIVVPLLISGARLVAPERWPVVMVLLNVLCGAGVAMLLVRMVRMITRSVPAAAVALLFYVAAYDVVAWLKFVLTDMVYSLLALATFAVAIRGIVEGGPATPRRLRLTILLVLCFITRPAGVVLIPLVIFVELMAAHPKRVAPWVFVIAAAAAVMLARAYFFDDMSRWPSDFMRPKLEEYAAREDTGEVVWDRKDSFRAPPHSIADHVVIQADRFVRFFQFTSPGFSRIHTLINIAYYVPLYLVGAVGAVLGWRAGDPRLRMVVQTTLLWLAAVAWFHAITILDFDWRYRLPVMPHLILLAAIGVDALLAYRRRQPWPAR
jgi:hypothetical protein